MKITKKQLKQIIKEEIKEAVDPAGIEVLFQAIEKFATQPEVATALAAGGITGAIQVIKDKIKGQSPSPATTPPETTTGLMEES